MFYELKYAKCYFPFIGLPLGFNKNHIEDNSYVCVSMVKFLFVLFHFLECIVEGLLVMIDYVILVKLSDF